MAYTKITKDMNIIAALDDEPNDVGGLTSSELKAKFDEGGLAVKTSFNGLCDELDASAAGTTATKTEVDQLHEAGAVKADFERLHDNHAADVPGFAYTTTAPTEANTDGLKVCVLASEPATKYDGWLYFIKQ